MASGTLKVEILSEGVHSGDASGVVPSSFRILRQVLDRLEDSKTGRLLPQSFHCEVPEDRLAQIQTTAGILGDAAYSRFPGRTMTAVAPHWWRCPPRPTPCRH